MWWLASRILVYLGPGENRLNDRGLGVGVVLDEGPPPGGQFGDTPTDAAAPLLHPSTAQRRSACLRPAANMALYPSRSVANRPPPTACSRSLVISMVAERLCGSTPQRIVFRLWRYVCRAVDQPRPGHRRMAIGPPGRGSRSPVLRPCAVSHATVIASASRARRGSRGPCPWRVGGSPWRWPSAPSRSVRSAAVPRFPKPAAASRRCPHPRSVESSR